jgi:hypothetical protein
LTSFFEHTTISCIKTACSRKKAQDIDKLRLTLGTAVRIEMNHTALKEAAGIGFSCFGADGQGRSGIDRKHAENLQSS